MLLTSTTFSAARPPTISGQRQDTARNGTGTGVLMPTVNALRRPTERFDGGDVGSRRLATGPVSGQAACQQGWTESIASPNGPTSTAFPAAGAPANIRTGAAHELTTDLKQWFVMIVIEHLNASAMAKNHCLVGAGAGLWLARNPPAA
jgi:hypothetical protein